MTTRRTATRLPMLIATIAMMIVGLMPAAPASADAGAGVGIIGTATLSTFPCPGPGSCGASFTGIAAVVAPEVVTHASASATVQYTDDCVTGTAAGTLTLSGGTDHLGNQASESVHFSWTRVGLTAVLIIDGAHTGAGVAAFVPAALPTLDACVLGSGSTTLHASVDGSGVWA